MAITSDDLNAFHRFAQSHLTNDGAESLRDLVDLWETVNSAPQLHAQNVAAIQAAIRDMENGDTGRPATKILEEMRAELAARRDQ